MFKSSFYAVALCLPLTVASVAEAGDGQSFLAGNWALTLGGSGFIGPKFEGSKNSSLQFAPIIAIGKQGPDARFVSRNDSPSFALLDQGAFRAGIAGKLIMPRDNDSEPELTGMKNVLLGVELGGFAEVYPTEFIRVRGEVRQGIRSHSGQVGDIAVDAFTDITPNIRVSGGPRVRLASSEYFDKYYGVTAAAAAAGGPSAYSPGGGVHSMAVGGAIDWKPTDQWSLSSFAEYRRLMGPAADSSLVRERGSANQFVVGLSASYKFNFTLD